MKTFQHAYQHSRAYKEIFQSAGIEVSDLSSVSCVVEGQYLDTALQALAEAFEDPFQVKERPKDYQRSFASNRRVVEVNITLLEAKRHRILDTRCWINLKIVFFSFLIQYPETSIPHHVLSNDKHGIFQKLDTNVKILAYEAI